MKTKMWEVEFGGWTKLCVIANNVKEAIRKAISKQGGEPYSRVQDITKVSLVAEED